jgi:hypothetical protein
MVGIAGVRAPGRQETTDKETRLPITKEALLGKREGRVGKSLVSVRFNKERVTLTVEEDRGGTRLIGDVVETGYEIDGTANRARLGSVAEAWLVKGGALKLRMKDALHRIPKGTVITLSRPMRRD